MTYLRHVLLCQLRYNGYTDCRRCILQTSQSRQFCPDQRKTDRGRSATNKRLLSGPVGRAQTGFVYHLVYRIFMLKNNNIELIEMNGSNRVCISPGESNFYVEK